MNCRYPDFLAASLCVSGQWDPVEVAKAAAHNNIFMGLSSFGPKEYPGMTAIIEEMKKAGANISRVDLNFRDGWEVNDAKVNAAIGDANIIFCVFDGETIWPDDGVEHRRMEHHNRGWELTYQLKSAKEWIFAKRK